jgi:crossover junction endodeoxyribonuclease RuvC
VIVCGIDPSLTGTGIAILHDGNPIALKKIGYPGHNGASDLDRSRRVVSLRHEIVNYVRQFTPHLVTIESPAYAQNHGSACDRHAYWHYLIHEFGVAGPERYAGITPTARAMFATGNGHASKKQVIDTVNTWWPHLNLRTEPVTRQQDNEADAVVLAVMGAAWAGDPLPFEMKDRHRNNLEAIAWPVMA